MSNNTSTYKQTPIGLIPTDWEVKRLGELCLTFKSGFGITAEQISEDGDYPVYGGNGLRGFTDSYTHKGAYFLIGRQGALCGNIIQIEGNSYISEHAIAVQTNKDNYNPFLAYKLEYQNLNRLSESSAQPGLSVEKLVRIKLSIPPLPEQQKIATILSTWDAAIDKCKEIIEKLKVRNKGLTQQLLTGKIRVKGFEGAKWHRLNADEVFVNHSQKNNLKNEVLLSATQDRGMIPRDMLEGRVTMPTGDTNSYKLVDKGDFVISLRSFQGGLEYSEYRGLVSPAYTVLKPIKAINDSFYKYYFKSYNFIGHLSVAVIGIRDGKNISYENFATIIIPNPSIEEQNSIANILDKATAELNQYQQKLQVIQLQKKGLMQQLLTGKVRVKVV